MRVTEQRVARLLGLGLTEGQARAYLALLDLGAAGIGDVARTTAMPRTRLYPVFNELHALGLVDVLAGEPLRYAPRPLEGYLSARVRALEGQRAELEAQAPELLREFAIGGGAAAAVEGRTRVFRGRENALLHLAEALEQARASAVLGCTRGTLARLAAAGLDKQLPARARAGVQLELLVGEGAPLPASLGAPGGTAVVHKLPGPLPWEVLLVDGRVVVAWVPRPDDAATSGPEDEGLSSSSGALHALFSGALAGLLGQRAAPEPRGRR